MGLRFLCWIPSPNLNLSHLVLCVCVVVVKFTLRHLLELIGVLLDEVGEIVGIDSTLALVLDLMNIHARCLGHFSEVESDEVLGSKGADDKGAMLLFLVVDLFEAQVVSLLEIEAYGQLLL